MLRMICKEGVYKMCLFGEHIWIDIRHPGPNLITVKGKEFIYYLKIFGFRMSNSYTRLDFCN